MQKLPEFVDMALTPRKETVEEAEVDMPQPVYPYGLCISLGDEQLEKLNMSDDCEVGDMIHMHCLAEVTSVSKNQTTEGTKCRVELQITMISAESEDEENDDAEAVMPTRIDSRKFYQSA